MSKKTMTGTQPLIDALDTANLDLAAKQAIALAAKQACNQAFADMRGSATTQRVAFTNLGGLVQTNSDGQETYILSCGYDVRTTARPRPPLEKAPTDVRTRINGTPGRVILNWKGVFGARNYEVQYTTDLTGATGWVSAPGMPGAGKLNVDELTSGTKYAFRVRALGNALPGPWSGPVQQMAP